MLFFYFNWILIVQVNLKENTSVVEMEKDVCSNTLSKRCTDIIIANKEVLLLDKNIQRDEDMEEWWRYIDKWISC